MSKVLNAFRDVRVDGELVSSPRPPQSVTHTITLPLSSKLRSLLSKAQQAVSSVGGQSAGATAVLRGATKVSVARSGNQLLAAISGKSLTGAVTNIQKAAGMMSLGAHIIEEFNPTNLRRPFVDGGSSVNPAQAAKSLALTTAASVLGSLISGVPVASGLPPQIKVFKTLVSLKKSPRYFSPTDTTTTTSNASPTSSYVTVGGPTSVLVAQRGLLQDEIMYRLTLLAENVYIPLSRRATSQGYASLVILEGFRGENSGASAHERGEALDLTLGDGTLSQAANLYALAQWARDHMMYDQLILCYSNIAGGQAWLHVTLTPESRRRQVLTKTFNDVHVPGLHLYGNYTDASILAQDRRLASVTTSVSRQVSQLLTSRETRLSPIGPNTPEQTPGFLSVRGTGTSTGGTPTPGGGDPDPSGGVYTANTALRSLVQSVTNDLLAIPSWAVLVSVEGHDETFVREVVRRSIAAGAPRSGAGAIGLNEKRGHQGPSRDAIAILNPTGCMGFQSWDAEKRVQIIDIISDTGSPNARGAWGDVTEDSWEVGGGFIPV